MAFIWQSSGFWLMLCMVLLLLVGCTVINNRMTPSTSPFASNLTPTPSTGIIEPPLMLFDNPIDITAFHIPTTPVYTPSSHRPPDRTPLSYDDIQIDDPICYVLANTEYACLGKIWNYSDQIIGDTQFSLAVTSEDSQPEQHTITLEQRLIPRGASATYRATLPASYDNTRTSFSSNILRILHPMEQMRPLSTALTHAHITSDRYHLTVTITNDSNVIADNIRLFTTLDTTEWGIVGYNVYEVESYLDIGEQQTIDIEIIPLALTPMHTITPILHAEGINTIEQ